jgi:hypothetical protein
MDIYRRGISDRILGLFAGTERGEGEQERIRRWCEGERRGGLWNAKLFLIEEEINI